MKNIITFLLILCGITIYAQDLSVRIDVAKYRHVPTAIRDTYVVPVSQTWRLYNITTDQWESNKGGAGWVADAGAGGGILSVLEDTSPQLGGDLETNGSNITVNGDQINNASSVSSEQIQINGDGIGTGLTGWQIDSEGTLFSSSSRMNFKNELSGGGYQSEYSLAWGGTPTQSSDLVPLGFVQANFAPITAGVTDGDKGDISVTASGATWTIDANTIDAARIQTDAVGINEIADNAVNTGEIVDGAVTSADIADGTVLEQDLSTTNAQVNGWILASNGTTQFTWTDPTILTGATSWGVITGTLSSQTDLQAELDALVPYTGATTDLQMGVNNIVAGGTITGGNLTTGGIVTTDGGQIQFLPDAVIGTNGTRSEFGLDSNNYYYFNTSPAAAFFGRLDFTGLTGSRTYTMPNLSGTVALTSDLNSYLLLAGGSMNGNISMDANEISNVSILDFESTDNLQNTTMRWDVANQTFQIVPEVGALLSYDTASDAWAINSTGAVSISNLAGNGTGVVAVDNSGNLSYSADPSAGTYLPLTAGSGQALTGELYGTGARFSDIASSSNPIVHTNGNGQLVKNDNLRVANQNQIRMQDVVHSFYSQYTSYGAIIQSFDATKSWFIGNRNGFVSTQKDSTEVGIFPKDDFSQDGMVFDYVDDRWEIATQQIQLGEKSYGRQYVKDNVTRATTANIALTGVVLVDGTNTGNGTPILVKNQTDASENGIYIASSSGAWTRIGEMNGPSEFSGAMVYVLEGTTNENTYWTCTNVGNVQVETTNITFVEATWVGGNTNWGTPVDTNILPDADQTHNIGAVGNVFQDIYANSFNGNLFGSNVEVATVSASQYFQIYPQTSDIDPSGFAANRVLLYNNSTDNRVKLGIGGTSTTESIAYVSDLIASDIVNTPSGNLAATDVQAALNELQIELDGVSGAEKTFVKADVKNATTGNITLSGNQTIDGNLTSTGERILVRAQTLPEENGIYAANSGAWTRVADMDLNSEFAGALIYVQYGNTLFDKYYSCTNTGNVIIGTTAITFAETTIGGGGGSGDMVLADAQTNSGIKTFLDTTFKLRNVANTFDGYFVNTNTADRVYTLQDAAGTIAFTSDITGTNSGTNTGDQTSIVGITGTSAEFNTANTDDDFAFLGDTQTFTGDNTFSGVNNYFSNTGGSLLANGTLYLGTNSRTDAGWNFYAHTDNSLWIGASETGTPTNFPTIYTLNPSGTPTLTTDLVDKAYADALGGGSGDMVLADVQTVTGAKTFTDQTLVLDDGNSAFNLTLRAFSGVASSDRVLNIDVNDFNRTLDITGDATISGTNSGDQTSIVGITGTKAEFNAAVTDGDIAYTNQVNTFTAGQTIQGTITSDAHIINAESNDWWQITTDIEDNAQLRFASVDNAVADSDYTLAFGGVPLEATDLIDKAYADANYSAGGGDVSKSGTPLDNQISVWTGDGIIEGTTGFTYNSGTGVLSVNGDAAVGGNVTIDGSTSGTATITAPAVAGTPTLTLPTSTGTLSTMMIVETVSSSITLDGFRGADDQTADTASFTVDGAVAGGTYQVIINRATAPSITGSTVMPNTQAFIADTKMSLTFVVNADLSVSHKYAQL